jgi:hypothetical protein
MVIPRTRWLDAAGDMPRARTGGRALGRRRRLQRWFVVASVAIAALGFASFAVIAGVSRDTSGGRARAGREGAVAPSTNAPQAAPGPAAVGDQAVAVSPPPTAPAAPAPQADPWAAIAPVERAEEMGEVGPAFAAALSTSFGALGQCFETSSAPRGAGATAHDGPVSEKRGPSVLLLEFETIPGGARIIDAPVGMRGAEADDVIACAQRVFRDMRLDVPGALPGKRYRMRYALVQ